MKLQKKTILSIILASLLVCAVSCGNDAETTETDSAQEGTQATVETTADTEIDFSSMSFIERMSYSRSQIADNLPEKDYGGAAFRIGYLDQSDPTDAYTLDWITTGENGDVLNDSVYQRNRAIEDRFNVQLTFVSHAAASYQRDVSNPILAGDDAFDMLSMHPGYYGKLITEKLFIHLEDLEYLDFTKPWWVSDSVEALSCKGTVYAAFGFATSVSMLGYAPVMYFNKTLAQNLDLDDYYQVVRDGKWTSDYLLSQIKLVSTDIDGDGKFTENDQVGLHLPVSCELYCYTWLWGGSYIVKDDEGVPQLNMENERMERLFDKAREFFATEGIIPEDGYSCDAFKSGSVLFESAHLSSITNFRDVTFDFGLLPNTKLDEEQENYLVNIGGGPQAIPTTCKDTEKAAILMEALNAEGYKQIMPAYFETVLKDKCARDEESAEMLDIAYAHPTVDGCYLFCPDMIYILDNYRSTSVGYASFTEKNMKKWTKTLDKNIETFLSE